MEAGSAEKNSTLHYMETGTWEEKRAEANFTVREEHGILTQPPSRGGGGAIAPVQGDCFSVLRSLKGS